VENVDHVASVNQGDREVEASAVNAERQVHKGHRPTVVRQVLVARLEGMVAEAKLGSLEKMLQVQLLKL